MVKWPADDPTMWAMVLVMSVVIYGLGFYAIRRARRADREDGGKRGSAAAGELKRWTVLLVAYSITAAVTMVGPTLMYGVFDSLGYGGIDQTTLFIWTMAAFVALVGVGGMVWWWRGDRSRGRRRCPKCWYDMAGVPRAAVAEKDERQEGWRCPECGRVAMVERRLLKTRRRTWRLVMSVFLLLVAIGGFIGGLASQSRWQQLIPTTALIIAMPYLEDGSELAYELSARIIDDPGAYSSKVWDDRLFADTQWRKRLLVARAEATLERSEQEGMHNMALYALVGQTEGGDAAANVVLPYCASPKANVRIAAIKQFVHHCSEYDWAVRVSMSLLNDDDSYVAASCLGNLEVRISGLVPKPKAPPEFLRAALCGRTYVIRTLATQGLDAFEYTPEVQDTVRKLLERPETGCTLMAVHAMKRVPKSYPLVDAYVRTWIASDDPKWQYWGVRAMLPDRLFRVDMRGVAALLPELAVSQLKPIPYDPDRLGSPLMYDIPDLLDRCLREPSLVTPVRQAFEKMGLSSAEIAEKLRAKLMDLEDARNAEDVRIRLKEELEDLGYPVADAQGDGAVGNHDQPLTTPSTSP